MVLQHRPDIELKNSLEKPISAELPKIHRSYYRTIIINQYTRFNPTGWQVLNNIS